MNFEKLKKLTKPFHDILETHPSNTPLFSEEATRHDYHDFLAIQYGVCALLEAKIDQSNLNDYPVVYRSRVDTLKKEFESLNMPLPKIASHSPSGCDGGIFVSLAALYLLEGSRHGAFMILAKIKKLMPDNYPFYFLETNKEEFFGNWGNIMQTISTVVTTKELEDKFILNVCQLYLDIESIYDRFSQEKC